MFKCLFEEMPQLLMSQCLDIYRPPSGYHYPFSSMSHIQNHIKSKIEKLEKIEERLDIHLKA